jgi:hypothetical protein
MKLILVMRPILLVLNMIQLTHLATVIPLIVTVNEWGEENINSKYI